MFPVGLLGSKPSQGSPQCDTNFGHIRLEVRRRGPHSGLWTVCAWGLSWPTPSKAGVLQGTGSLLYLSCSLVRGPSEETIPPLDRDQADCFPPSFPMLIQRGALALGTGMLGSWRVAGGLRLWKGSWQPPSALSFWCRVFRGQGQVGGAVERTLCPHISLLCHRPFLLESLKVIPQSDWLAMDVLTLAL